MLSYYVAVFERSDDGFGVFFPEVPGCTSFGTSVADAARNASEALEGHLTLAVEHGEAIPAPSGIVDMPVDPEVQEVCRLLVGFEPSAKPIRVNITLPESLLAEVDRTAEADGFTRSGFLAQAARERLRQHAAGHLRGAVTFSASSSDAGSKVIASASSRDATGGIVRPSGKAHAEGKIAGRVLSQGGRGSRLAKAETKRKA